MSVSVRMSHLSVNSLIGPVGDSLVLQATGMQGSTMSMIILNYCTTFKFFLGCLKLSFLQRYLSYEVSPPSPAWQLALYP